MHNQHPLIRESQVADDEEEKLAFQECYKAPKLPTDSGELKYHGANQNAKQETETTESMK